jgi:hypothetical protein
LIDSSCCFFLNLSLDAFILNRKCQKGVVSSPLLLEEEEEEQSED